MVWNLMSVIVKWLLLLIHVWKAPGYILSMATSYPLIILLPSRKCCHKTGCSQC